MTLYILRKTAEENAKVLQEAAKTVFSWTEENAVQFNDSKSELIHFFKARRESTAEITLLNKTVIKLSTQVKWLRVWLNKKLSFKTHI